MNEILTSQGLKPLHEVFQSLYGDEGAEVYTNLTTNVHLKLGLGKGLPQPYSSFVGEFFMRCAVGNPQETILTDYLNLVIEFEEARQTAAEKNHPVIPTPTFKTLRDAMKVHFNNLEHPSCLYQARYAVQNRVRDYITSLCKNL